VHPGTPPPISAYKLQDVIRRLSTTAFLTLTALLVLAAPVLAHDGGEGLWGETNDRVVTNAGFILIIFFPLFIFFASVIQWRLDVRKNRRKAAAKARDTSGGW
jgi:peptidoglycan biosynthesis protein MviN/MurJ (putative lipid II flippase)